jgi:glycosyltransferase involved in cell wall biosynthesis
MAEKVAELLDDRDRRAAMGEYGRRRVENELEWKYVVPKLLAAYEVAFAKKGLQPRSPHRTTRAGVGD